MKEFKLYIPAFISLSLMILLAVIFGLEQKKMRAEENKQEDNNKITYNYHIETKENISCELNTYNDFIYSYCLDEININHTDTVISLKEDLNNGFNLNELINNLKVIKEYGKDILYEDKNDGFTNNGLKVIKCNNGSFIFGSKDLEYKEEYCKE